MSKEREIKRVPIKESLNALKKQKESPVVKGFRKHIDELIKKGKPYNPTD